MKKHYQEGWAAFDAGLLFDDSQTKEWQNGWIDCKSHTADNDEEYAREFPAFCRIDRLRRYGSHRTKTLIRKNKKLDWSSIDVIVRVAGTPATT